MKRIVIVGQNSYIGNSLIKHLDQQKYEISTICAKTTSVTNMDFSGVDSVFLVAGIAHVSASSNQKGLYFKINRDLAIDIAKRAKETNAKQFIFMSSMIIYGEARLKKEFVISNTTPFDPIGFYGRSKLEADIAIEKLNSPSFKTVIIRSPMVYGPNSRGNFPRLVNLTRKTFIFPKINNKRSMIYIENLCEFIKLVVDNESAGVFMPQNTIQPSTSAIVSTIAKHLNHKILISRIFNPIIWFFALFLKPIRKVFGSRTYDLKMTQYFDNSYNIVDFEESIKRSIKNKE